MTRLTDSIALTAEDEEDLRRRGISHTTLSQQLATFQKGIPFTHILRPCTINDGVTVISSADQASLVGTCDAARLEGRITKFVPASGAATRMFKSLLAACPPTGSVEQTTPPSEADRRVVQQFLDQLEQFAFYEDLEGLIHQEGQELNGLHPQHHQDRILRAVLHHPGLNYSRLPKGLLKFHKYSNDSRTPILEHLVEGTIYAKDEHNRVRIHFTISPEHQTAIYQHLEEASQRLGSLDCQWDITCSEQLPSTDTLAVDPQNQPFRDREGKLLFRPGGHGALLTNLNALQGDIVFVKNIDNVLPDTKTAESNTYKKLLGGELLLVQQFMFQALRQLEDPQLAPHHIQEIVDWAESALRMTLPPAWRNWSTSQHIQWLSSYLNRPIRVCGMVQNTGDPGGGPFWVRQKDGSVSLQIVESSQINVADPEQQEIFRSSTHFNPVDMVCGLRDYRGRPFDLHQFTDPNTGFISKKSHEGRDLKALELPGLWNGGMAGWHTLFMEVPRSTFNPVKTVLDLLHPTHQPE